ncbi:MAG: FtsX-like permease family protein [Micropepsaceae bacterium]
MSPIGLAVRFARRELRSGLSGFWVFLGCLTLGVAAIAGVGSLGAAFTTGLAEQGRTLLGGDVSLRRLYEPASEVERAFMERFGDVSMSATMRSMANAAGETTRNVVEIRAVDESFPMLGAVTLEPTLPLSEALACDESICGTVVEGTLFARLGIEIGDAIHVGDTDYLVRAQLFTEPDRISGGFSLGPRVMISREGLERSGLVVPGSLINYHYDVAFNEPLAPDYFEAVLDSEFPAHTWRVRDHTNAVPAVARFVRQATLFLTLVGLTALVVGGVGAGQAINAFIERRRESIATLKALGAEGGQVFLIYMVLVMFVAMIGLAAGLAIGAALPFAVEYFAGSSIPAPANYALYPRPLILAAAFGVLTAFGFAVLPLSRAREINPAGLFRDLVAPSSTHGRWPYRLAAFGALAAVAILSVNLSRYEEFTIGFLAGCAGILVALKYSGLALQWLIARTPHGHRQILRIAFANLTRPGTQSTNVIVALGLGLTLLATVALTEASVRSEVAEQLPDRAPSFFFVDIQKDQIEAFTEIVAGAPSAIEFEATPMLRARIVALNGVSVEQARVQPDPPDIPNGDRGLTYMAEAPRNVTIFEGPDWWPADYDGPPLISLDEDLAEDMRLSVGDSLTVNVLGRDIEAQIFNLRDDEFRNIGIDFSMILSPGEISAAPHTFISTVRLAPEDEGAVFDAVTQRFPNVTVVRVKEAIAQVGVMLETLATGMTAASFVTILAGILVLAGAIAAGHRARLYDAVVMKVLGATRARLAAVYAVEYGLLGMLAGIASFGAGTIAGWWVTEIILEIPFVFAWRAVALTVIGGAIGTLVLGLIGGIAALSAKPAARLRNP